MPDYAPHSVIHGLPLMSFRGISAPPYDVAGFGFAHSHGARSYPYIDGTLHDWTGLNDQKIGFKLYFLNTLEPAAFPDAWAKWWKELQDGSPGEMVHPLLGPRQVVVKGGDVQLTAKSTAGIVVDVNFETTILDPEEEQAAFTIAVDIAALTETALAEAENAEVPPPSEESAVDVTQVGDQLTGAIYSLELTALGLINRGQSIATDYITNCETVGHTAYKARDAFVTLWAALEDLAEKIGAKQARETGSVLTTQDKTLDAFARDRGNTTAEVAGLNVAALASPVVPSGTLLKFYK